MHSVPLREKGEKAMKQYQSPFASVLFLTNEDILRTSGEEMVIPTIKPWDGNEQGGSFTDLF